MPYIFHLNVYAIRHVDIMHSVSLPVPLFYVILIPKQFDIMLPEISVVLAPNGAFWILFTSNRTGVNTEVKQWNII